MKRIISVFVLMFSLLVGKVYSQAADSVLAPTLKKFLEQNIKYPDVAKKSGVQGKVSISFKINQDGTITDIARLKTLPDSCDDEVVSTLKNFKGYLGLKPDIYTFSVVFEFDEWEGANSYAWRDRKKLKNFLFGIVVGNVPTTRSMTVY